VAAIEAIAFTGTAGFAVIIVATILVTAGIRHEQRYRTRADQHRPAITALLARRVLQAQVRLPPGEQHDRDNPQEIPPQHERPPGPTTH
jgi:hypothetical protein